MLSRFRLLPIMFILLAVLLVGLPVAAQDLVTNTPAGEVIATAEVTEPAPVETPAPPVVEPTEPGLTMQITPYLVGIVIVVLVIAGVLLRTAIIQLGASVPLLAYQTAKGAGLAALEQVGNYVLTTESKTDDEAYKELRKMFEQLVIQIEEQRAQQSALFAKHFPSTPIPPQSSVY
jgi:hypothetical protein